MHPRKYIGAWCNWDTLMWFVSIGLVASEGLLVRRLCSAAVFEARRLSVKQFPDLMRLAVELSPGLQLIGVLLGGVLFVLTRSPDGQKRSLHVCVSYVFLWSATMCVLVSAVLEVFGGTPLTLPE